MDIAARWRATVSIDRIEVEGGRTADRAFEDEAVCGELVYPGAH